MTQSPEWKPIEEPRMTETTQVKVTDAERHKAEQFNCDLRCGKTGTQVHNLARLLARHRTQALADHRALVEALEANKQGWENAVEFGLLPRQHHETARALIEQCRATLAALKETDNG